jgi:tetratricopeptide (TPR) repeat protein
MRASAYILGGECNEKMAMESHFQQPPLTMEFGDSELQVLGYALSHFRKASELAPHMHRPGVGADRVMQILIQFAKAPELTRVARVLRETGFPYEALIFLMLSLNKDERLAATHYELGLVSVEESANNPEKEDEARKLIERALQLDPSNQEYRATLRRLGQPGQ